MENDLTSFRDYETGDRLLVYELYGYLQFDSDMRLVRDEEESVITYFKNERSEELLDYFMDNLGTQPNITRTGLYKEMKAWGNRVD